MLFKFLPQMLRLFMCFFSYSSELFENKRSVWVDWSMPRAFLCRLSCDSKKRYLFKELRGWKCSGYGAVLGFVIVVSWVINTKMSLAWSGDKLEKEMHFLPRYHWSSPDLSDLLKVTSGSLCLYLYLLCISSLYWNRNTSFGLWQAVAVTEIESRLHILKMRCQQERFLWPLSKVCGCGWEVLQWFF